MDMLRRPDSFSFGGETQKEPTAPYLPTDTGDGGTSGGPADVDVEVRGSGQLPEAWRTWEEVTFPPRVRAPLVSAGFKAPTSIQQHSWPILSGGRDLIGIAKTGSGKTLAFLSPIFAQLLESRADLRGPPAALILAPTRELAVQIETEAKRFGETAGMRAACLYGGAPKGPQLAELRQRPQLLVATPGRLNDLLEPPAGLSVAVDVKSVRYLVLDEADLMFSFGYEEDVKSLCALMPPKYQAMLVSATLSEEVEQLKGLMLHKPVVLKLEEPRVTGKLSQFYFICHKTEKYLILYTLLKLQLIQGKTLIFVKSVDAAYRLKILLERFSINSLVLNSELPHASRQNILDSFNQGLVELLIATDEGVGIADEAEDEDDDMEGEEEEMEDEDEEEEMEVESKQAAVPRRSALKKPIDAKAKKAEIPVEQEDEDEDEEDEDEEAEEEEEEEDVEEEVAPIPAKQEKEEKHQKGRKAKVDQHYSLTRGVDLHAVSTVLNADVPATVRDYVHRVGRCARGGASGTALTLCTYEEEPQLQKILRAQSAAGGTGALQPLPMQISDAERFRYRVEDMARGLTKQAVAKYRARELQMEALHSEKLKAYFDDHPDDKLALQRMQRELREKKSIRAHLKHIPSYLVPEDFTKATPVQQAVRTANKASGKISSHVKRKKVFKARQQDPLTSEIGGVQKRRDRFTRERAIALDRKIDPSTANVEALPALSRHKLWKLRHGKRVRKTSDVFGERRQLDYGQKKRRKKFNTAG